MQNDSTTKPENVTLKSRPQSGMTVSLGDPARSKIIEFLDYSEKHEQSLIDAGMDTVHVSRSRTLRDSIRELLAEYPTQQAKGHLCDAHRKAVDECEQC